MEERVAENNQIEPIMELLCFFRDRKILLFVYLLECGLESACVPRFVFFVVGSNLFFNSQEGPFHNQLVFLGNQ